MDKSKKQLLQIIFSYYVLIYPVVSFHMIGQQISIMELLVQSN
jgi:hypothetical protein